MRIFAVVWCIIFSVLQPISDQWGGEEAFAFLCMIQMLLMISVYIVIMIMLNKQMRGMNGSFRDEIMSINA